MGDERTWAREISRHECPACQGVAGSTKPCNCDYPGGYVEVWYVEKGEAASVLEERDRQLVDTENGWTGCKSHVLELEAEAEVIRSQLTEARAAREALEELRAYADSPVKHGESVDSHELWLRLSEAVHEAIYKGSGLVPAPQDREPTT